MAEEKENETTEEEQPEKKKSGNMLMIIIIVVLILIIIGGGIAAFLLLSGDDEETQQSSTPAQVQEKPAKTVTKTTPGSGFDDSRKLSELGVMYPVDPFTVNLKSDSGSRYLKVAISLELEGEELSLELDAHTAVIRNIIIRVLTSKTLEEVSSQKGKHKLSNQIMNLLNERLSDGKIKGIYFTEFVIQ